MIKIEKEHSYGILAIVAIVAIVAVVVLITKGDDIKSGDGDFVNIYDKDDNLIGQASSFPTMGKSVSYPCGCAPCSAAGCESCSGWAQGTNSCLCKCKGGDLWI